MSENGNGLSVGGDVQRANVIWGNENTIIQIINQVYDRDDLVQLVREAFPQADELLDFWSQTFPAIDPKLRLRDVRSETQSFYEELVHDFKRMNEVGRLLSETKKRSPTAYRDFLAGQVLEGIGLSKRQLPAIEIDRKSLEAELLNLQQLAISHQKPASEDSLEFEDRIDVFEKIRQESSGRIVLHGPSGVGKTYLLQHLPDKYPLDTRCTLIDLSSCEVQNILPRIVEQLGGQPNTGKYLELATVLNTLLIGSPPIHRFYFLFDNADRNQAAIDYLFSPESPLDNTTLQRLLKDWGLQDRIELKIIMAAKHPVSPTKIFLPAFSTALQIKLNPLNREYVQNMLEKIIEKRNLPKHFKRISKLSNEVYYLAGGHPKCTKQMLLALADQGCVIPTADEWEQLYKAHVISTIHVEMLQAVDLSLLPIIWNISIFRRFDQRLLGGLLRRGVLENVPPDISRRARELRSKLEKMNLFDVDVLTSSIYPNYVMRHALSLNMQLNAPERYQMLHSVALEMYLDRIQGSEPGAEQQTERMATNLLELIYHATKLLEVEFLKKRARSQVKLVWKKMRNAFENYLLLALSMVGNEDRSGFLRILKAKLSQDQELREAIQRLTANDKCLQELQLLLEKYDDHQGEPV